MLALTSPNLESSCTNHSRAEAKAMSTLRQPRDIALQPRQRPICESNLLQWNRERRNSHPVTTLTPIQATLQTTRNVAFTETIFLSKTHRLMLSNTDYKPRGCKGTEMPSHTACAKFMKALSLATRHPTSVRAPRNKQPQNACMH